MKELANYINGNARIVLYEDGTLVHETLDPSADHFTYDFPRNADIKITDYCDGGCRYCHENSTVHGRHGDLRSLEPLIDSLHPGTEMACGGGDALAHPDLLWFLEKLRDRGVIANITVNQRHLLPHSDLLRRIVDDGLVHGIGVSLVDSSDRKSLDFADSLGPNVVYHVIAGVFCEDDVRAVVGRKVLILGYKLLRRGRDNFFSRFGDARVELGCVPAVQDSIAMMVSDTAAYPTHRNLIVDNIRWLRTELPRIASLCRCVSFDCLGIEQVDPKRILGIGDEAYLELFQGSDTDVTDVDGNITCGTMYIDVPNMQVARMSTAPLEMRHGFAGTETIEDLFRKSILGWTTTKPAGWRIRRRS